MKVITVLNFKGGVGKTETSKNIAKGLANLNKKVLVIDNDPQSNTTKMLKKEDKIVDLVKDCNNIKDLTERLLNNQNELTLSDLYLDPSKILNAIVKTDVDNLDLIPCSLRLANTEKQIKDDSTKPQHNRIKQMLRRIEDIYDYVIIDSAPSLNLLTINSLVATTENVIIPIKIDTAGLQGYAMTVDMIEQLNNGFNLNLDYKILFTMVQKTSGGWLKECNTIINKMYEILPKENIYNTIIRNQNKAVVNAGFTGTYVIDNDSKVGEDYKNLVNELLEVR